MGAEYHLKDSPIPEGFRILEERLEVAGLGQRRAAGKSVVQAPKRRLELERDLHNRHDPNAIRVYGRTPGLFSERRQLLGFVPREAAKRIVEAGIEGQVQPRLLKTWLGDSGFVEILFQILVPADSYPEPASPAKHGHYTKCVERVKWLKREKRHAEAIELLLEAVDSTEAEAEEHGWGVAPWYYEQLAIIYRKEKNAEAEVEILERYETQTTAAGSGPSALRKRLKKARQLLR